MRIAASLFVLMACVGCGPKEQSSTSPTKTPPVPVSERALTLIGPGGSVSIGGTLDDAKKAFPAPKGAEEFDTSMNFAILGDEGWAWGVEMGTGFEVLLKNGKVAALILTELDGPKGEQDVAEQISSVGEPTRKSENDSTAMYVWESGANARFYIVLKSEMPLFGVGSFTVIGDKDQLKLLNYRYDDPETFVKQMDNAAKQMEELQKSKGKSESGKP